MAYSVYVDVDAAGAPATTILPYLLLFVALLIALGFEFVNGFHDTANAVATVIYTHSMPAPVAVVWSGFFNFLGVVLSSGAVAFGIISLLPVELILQVGTSAGFAMVFGTEPSPTQRPDHYWATSGRYSLDRMACSLLGPPTRGARRGVSRPRARDGSRVVHAHAPRERDGPPSHDRPLRSA